MDEPEIADLHPSVHPIYPALASIIQERYHLSPWQRLNDVMWTGHESEYWDRYIEPAIAGSM